MVTVKGVIHMEQQKQPDVRIIKIQRDLQEHYLKSFENVSDPQMKQIYETMVKLNAEMIGKALQRYNDEF